MFVHGVSSVFLVYIYIYIYTETNFWPKTRNIIPTKGRVARVPGFSHVELSHTIAERTSRRPYDDAFLGECDVPLHRPDIGLHLHPGFYIPSIHIWWVPSQAVEFALQLCFSSPSVPHFELGSEGKL